LNQVIKNNRIIEKWSQIITELGIDLTKPVNYVTADEIKEITNKEPRIMAKMDRIECLPDIFRQNCIFLLPVSRSKYALVKGNGHHMLEKFETTPEIFRTSNPFPTAAIGIEGESVFLDYANSCGLLQKLCGFTNLIPSVRGRTTTQQFDFLVSGTQLQVNNAQIEIDASYESKEQLLLFEAKIGIPSSFSIKQLYYPYRKFTERKQVRCFFFCFIPSDKYYVFWEYGFDKLDDYNSIRLLKYKIYQIRISTRIPIMDSSSVKPSIALIDIPQADDVNKIVLFPFMVSEGYNTAKKMVEAFAFDVRQSSYYRQAAEILGLVRRDKSIYKITPKGESLIQLNSKARPSYMCRLLLDFPILNEIFLGVTVENKNFSRGDIVNLLKSKSHLTGATLWRRTQTIIAWFRWIKNNVGLVNVQSNGTIYPITQ
jgi:hypothetical protein